jgi:hypothetical protein
MRAYHLAFATAAIFAIAAVAFSITIHDSDAAETIVRRRPRAERQAHPLPVRESLA